MIRIRLARAGSKKRPYYSVVVTNRESARDGRFVERIGTYDPFKPMSEAKVDRARIAYWIGTGAQLSDRVSKLLTSLPREPSVQV